MSVVIFYLSLLVFHVILLLWRNRAFVHNLSLFFSDFNLTGLSMSIIMKYSVTYLHLKINIKIKPNQSIIKQQKDAHQEFANRRIDNNNKYILAQ